MFAPLSNTAVYTGSRLQRVRLQRAPAYKEQISFHQFTCSNGLFPLPNADISIRGSESESEPVEKFCIVQESVSVSESESGSGNKPHDLFLLKFSQILD